MYQVSAVGNNDASATSWLCATQASSAPDVGSMALSRFHFAQMFHQSVGISPHEFVLQQRLARARALLSRTNAPLLDVAASCGFADQSHMNRVFRKRTGLTPGQFRASGAR